MVLLTERRICSGVPSRDIIECRKARKAGLGTGMGFSAEDYM